MPVYELFQYYVGGGFRRAIYADLEKVKSSVLREYPNQKWQYDDYEESWSLYSEDETIMFKINKAYMTL
jgi:hypothetical protein